jgi:hypothetical protein
MYGACERGKVMLEMELLARVLRGWEDQMDEQLEWY